jgi:hypothetical protein
MANMTLIEAKTSTSTSVTFSSIPQTYTDLRIVISSRDNDNSNPWTRFDIELNSDTTSGNYRTKYGYSTGSGTGSSSGNEVAGYSNSSGNTAATFSNCEIYIPSYSATIAKSWTWNAVTSQMATAQLDVYGLGDWSSTAPITQVKIKSGGTFLTGSTFYLYGIPNVTVGAKATGGTVYSDGIYNYHTFLATGTFTPTVALTADILVIAGGGSASSRYGGGGGAGGIAYKVGSSLTATAYTCTVGAGGASTAVFVNPGNQGTNSSIAGSGFSTITANGGGYGGGATNDSSGNASAGGSGGGGGGYFSGNTPGGASNQTGSGGSTGYGNAGGNGISGDAISGGGGGAGTAGVNGSGNTSFGQSGNGGNGLNTWSSWAVATGTGDRGFFAGGGGGGGRSDALFTNNGLGGIGGGGNGVYGDVNAINGTANTGGGGGGSWNGSSGGGGSGLVIIRYAK